jgi:hypothetical protein
MAEPVTLYKDDQVMIVHAPSEVVRLRGEGWQETPPVVVEPEPVDEPKPARRGRPPKGA